MRTWLPMARVAKQVIELLILVNAMRAWEAASSRHFRNVLSTVRRRWGLLRRRTVWLSEGLSSTLVRISQVPKLSRARPP